MSHKTALVTGASGNLGKGVVDYFIEHNYQTIGIVHHQDKKPAQNENYHEFELDLLDENATQQCVEKVFEKFKKVDTAILTAGGFKMNTIKKTSAKELEEQYRLNFKTAYTMARPLLEKMKKQNGGALFFIGSKPGMDTRKSGSTVAYSLSKSLLFQLANIINAEMKASGIRAYVVVPDIIDTPPNRAAMPDADFSQWEKPGQIAEIIGRYAEDPNKNQHRSTLVVQSEL